MKPWKLNDSNFSFFDRLKICRFFLQKKNFWTMNSKVRLFEEQMAQYIGSKYAVFVSSGSTANTVLAMYLKDHNKEEKKQIIFPSTTWTTSISPFIREGFEPIFLDISLSDFSLDLDALETYLKENNNSVACVFVTSLIGFVPDINRLKEIGEKYQVKIMMDNCENTFGSFRNKNISSFFTSTTSTYFGHQIQSVEGGFIFTNSYEEYEYFLMLRNHGMTRSIAEPEKYANPDVDARFDFYCFGNNFRNSDIHAFIGLLDFKRIAKLKKKREKLFNLYANKLLKFNYKIETEKKHSPFCLPIICENQEQKQKIFEFCETNQIETRPIISGNLLRQTCYSKFGNANNFPNSDFLHKYCFYVGLHYNVQEKQILNLVNFINSTI
jgi:CDP-6-deoxy-D-xylo-4-hexulose-3-dehydrase